MNHLEQYNILTKLQHGCLSGHSCESQLIITLYDMKQYDSKKQTGLAILDSSKAFDTVPHQKLLQKLKHYGIDGKINKWIGSFLTQRKQKVVIEVESSLSCSVDSVYRREQFWVLCYFMSHKRSSKLCQIRSQTLLRMTVVFTVHISQFHTRTTSTPRQS